MKLLCEFIEKGDLQILNEVKNDIKICRLKGPFLEAAVKNKNGRIYSEDIIIREVKKYNEEKISKKRSLGELDHPENPTINLERVSHVVESLVMEGNKGIGVARLMDTPMGRIARTLVDEGILLGMSTRGVGTLDGEMVKDDYFLIGVDIVCDPSAPSAFVEGVLENKEYIMNGDQIVEVAIQNLQKSVDKKYDPKSISNHVLRYMNNFLEEIQQKNVRK